jgi:hypothetical protein
VSLCKADLNRDVIYSMKNKTSLVTRNNENFQNNNNWDHSKIGFSLWHGHPYFWIRTYLGSLAPNSGDNQTLHIFGHVGFPVDSMSLSHPFSNMLNHGHFYFGWPCVKQSETTTHISTNERLQKVVVMAIGHYTTYSI